MSTQPNALRLADDLENCTVEDLLETSLVEEAYEELRAQQTLIGKLKAALLLGIEDSRCVLSHIEQLDGEHSNSARDQAKQIDQMLAAMAAAEAHK